MTPAGIYPMPAPHTPAAILFTFDDGRASVYTAAYPVLAAAGLAATAYIIRSRVGTAGYMTEEQILELDAAGWDIANHTVSHNTLKGASEAAQEAEMSGCADYLDGLGLTRASHHVAYPYGESDANTLTALAATGMLTGRKFASGSPSYVPVASTYDAFAGFNLGTDANGTLAKAEQWLQPTTAGKIAVFVGHYVDDSGGPYAWTPNDLASLAAYAKTCGAPIVTISQLYDYIQAGYVWP